MSYGWTSKKTEDPEIKTMVEIAKNLIDQVKELKKEDSDDSDQGRD